MTQYKQLLSVTPDLTHHWQVTKKTGERSIYLESMQRKEKKENIEAPSGFITVVKNQSLTSYLARPIS
jgi:hypothetical protein